MGNEGSKGYNDVGEDPKRSMQTAIGRAKAITGAKATDRTSTKPLLKGPRADPSEHDFIQSSLSNLLLFNKLDRIIQRKIVTDMYELPVAAGDILIQQGDVGVAANQLYVVKGGKFEVLERRRGVNMRVNVKERGDCFGEISLMYNCPRSATVAATTDAVVWVLDRDVFRHYVQTSAEEEIGQVELFLNSVPLLSPLSREDKMRVVDALVEEPFAAGTKVIVEGDKGDKFFIIKEGEAVVTASEKEVNRLFKADFFGEAALLHDEPRKATVRAVTNLVCLSLQRETFIAILGPLQDIMDKEKSAEATSQRMAKLKPKSSAAHRRPTAEVVIKYSTSSGKSQGTATGHLDEVNELRKGGSKLTDQEDAGDNKLVLIEGELLGEGAFSRVCKVAEETTSRQFALKRMTKQAALQCPEHVFCEQYITRNLAHPFCIRQYCSFQDKYHLYFLFDLMPGGDLMDVLVAEAKVIKYPVPEKGSLRQGCLAPKVKMWQGMEEDLAKFYVASIVLSLEYLHTNNIVYRDLKPENVLIDAQGFAKLGDFGFAKQIENGGRTYTFCGTPGYVAPENIMGRGYNHSVDWWTLGVLMYVLLTARQPFTSPKTQDPMEVMRRIVDERWPVKYPPYMSDAARDLISRLLERKPVKRLGMLSGKAVDIKKHPWFKDFDWEALSSRRLDPPRKPKDGDSAKRKAELTEAHKAEAREPNVTSEEMAEYDLVFKEF